MLHYTYTAESCHKQYGTIPLSDAYLFPFKVTMVLLDLFIDYFTFFYAEYSLHPFFLFTLSVFPPDFVLFLIITIISNI